MKKHFLLKHRGILIALLCFLCVISIQAQTWTAPALTGSIPASGTTYYMYNVGSNGYLNRGGWYGMFSVVTASPTANASSTIIKWTARNTSGSIWTFQYNNGSDVSNNYLFAASNDGSIFTDNSSNNTWNVVETDATNKIYSIQVRSDYGDGYNASQYLGSSIGTEDTDKGTCNVVRYNRASGDSYTQWKFVSQADLDLYNARILLDKYMTYAKNKAMDVSSYITTYNATDPADINNAAATLLTALGRTDVTSSITNPSFETGTSQTGWTNNGSFENQTNTPLFTKDGTNFTQKYTSDYNLAAGSITQTVSSLSSGLYELVVSGHAVQQRGANPLHTGAYITAGSQSTEVVAGQDYSISNITVTGTTLPIGYSLVAPTHCNWTGFDNFRLYYYGPVSCIGTSVTSLGYDNLYTNSSFTLTGNSLTSDITLTVPSGITLTGTNITGGSGTYTIANAVANATNTITATWDGSTTVLQNNITISATNSVSGSTSTQIRVNASSNTGCYTPAYPSGNMIADPTFSYPTFDAGGFGGWGSRAITHTRQYCGGGGAYVLGNNSGSIDRTLSTANGNALKANTKYRLRAMINSQASSGKYFQFHIEGVNGSASQYFNIYNTSGWNQFDATFTTGATVSEHGIYFNSYTFPNVPALTDTCFIDNYEMYAIPTWNGTGNWGTAANWTGTVVPSTGADIYVMSGTLTINENISVANVTVAPGAALILNSDNTLTVTGDFTINSDANGTGVFVDANAAGALTVSGTSTVQQYLTGADADATPGVPDGRYWYLTSPVVGATSSIFTPSTTANRLWSYNEAGGDLSAVYIPITDGAVVLTAGKGYVTCLTGNTTVNFTGTALVNGAPTVALTYTASSPKAGFNLIGNPYPSYMNIKTAIAGVTDMDKGIWYRSFTGGIMGFDTYNTTDGIQAKHNPEASTTVLTDFVPPMQAFWVKATAATTITLANSLRSHQPTGNLLRSVTSSLQKVRLAVSNGIHSDETFIGFYPDAIDAFDNHDSHKMFNGVASLPEIYTLSGSEAVAINGLAPFTDSKEIVIGFNTMQAGIFTIKASELLNMEEGQTVILKDKLLNVNQNLTEQPVYSFSSDAVTTTTRFSLVIGKMATALKLAQKSSFEVRALNNGQMEIALDGATQASVKVFDTVGRQVFAQDILSQTSPLSKTFSKGVYLVKVSIGGVESTKKVVINL